ncbi:MAG: ABC transporter ATP-binding protein [Gammaproteobacteria bacterium]|nr:MAG: ABC transporter ATP-binding protein [Gammaproteobacteria bacterium]
MAVEYKNVKKSYSGSEVLKGVDLKIGRGEFLGLVGANGAGKTTLIKSLLDFIGIDSGQINIFGIKNTNPQSRDKLIFLPERFVPPYYLKGGDFLKYLAKLHQIEFDYDKACNYCKKVGLEPDALSKPVRKYSKGMAQKLGLAGCFMSQKELLILDEPMSGLDPMSRVFLKKALADAKESGQTCFFSTHMLADVESVCDRIAILHKGELSFIGSTAECLDKYKAKDLEQAYLNCVCSQ